MKKLFCDACGGEMPTIQSSHGIWEITIKFYSFWNPSGDERTIQLCDVCGPKGNRLLGFQYDTGKILSISRQEMIDGVTVYGANGGGLGDIALNGVGGANSPRWHARNEKVPIAAAMLKNK